MKRLMTFVGVVWACVVFASETVYEWVDASAGVTYTYAQDGAGVRLSDVELDAAVFEGRLEIPDTLPVDEGALPVVSLGTESISGNSIRTARIPASITKISSYAFGRNAITNVIFACSKPELEVAWTGTLDPDRCIFSVLPSAKGWGTLPGIVSVPFIIDGEVAYEFKFQIVSTALNPDYVVTISPEGGAFRDVDYVQVSLTQNAVPEERGIVTKIYYTTDGADPDEDSSVWNPERPPTIGTTTTVKAYVAVYQEGREGQLMLMAIGPTAEATYQFPRANGGPYVEEVDGTNWTYMVKGGKATIERVSFEQPAVPVETAGELTLPAELGLRPVAGVGVSAFERCRYLTKVVFPETVTTIASFAFKDCLRLKDVVYAGEKPAIDLAAFDGCPLAVVPGPIVTVKVAVPIEIQADPDDGTLDIPENWLDLMAERFGGETWKTQFTDRFGDGSTNTLKVATGKVDRSGHALQVWQEYVAGTDPLDADSALKAFVEMTAEGPVITWSPDLSDEGRVYTIYGMKNLTDRQKPTDVTALTPAERQAAGYRFFFVAVRLAPAAGGAE
ncbi:MAG: leucine-rich repeat protein [Kiritimatiellae bacterium]|nr:leucine-rich repeat protein [Kiritimatiellia bacterium]